MASGRGIVVEKAKDFFRKGEEIVREGHEGKEMYIIKSGKVEVVKSTGDEEIVLATLEPKAFFGEMALFGEPRRSATIRAVEDTQMIVINKRMLDASLEQVPPWFVTILKTLADRLKATNQAIKSRFKINFEFSVLKMVYLFAKKHGEKSGDSLSVELDKSLTAISNVLGIAEGEMLERLKNLAFVGLLKYSEPKNQILIPDGKRLMQFLTYLRSKATGIEDATDLTRTDEALKNYFEKLYKLLFRRKM